MAVNGDEIDNAVGEDAHGANSYFEAFAGSVPAGRGLEVVGGHVKSPRSFVGKF